MKAIDAMIVWTPSNWPAGNVSNQGEVAVLSPDDGLGKEYSMWQGRGNKKWRVADDCQRLAMLFGYFVEITVADGIESKAVHSAFSKIDEYKKILPRRSSL